MQIFPRLRYGDTGPETARCICVSLVGHAVVAICTLLCNAAELTFYMILNVGKSNGAVWTLSFMILTAAFGSVDLFHTVGDALYLCRHGVYVRDPWRFVVMTGGYVLLTLLQSYPLFAALLEGSHTVNRWCIPAAIASLSVALFVNVVNNCLFTPSLRCPCVRATGIPIEEMALLEDTRLRIRQQTRPRIRQQESELAVGKPMDNPVVMAEQDVHILDVRRPVVHRSESREFQSSRKARKTSRPIRTREKHEPKLHDMLIDKRRIMRRGLEDLDRTLQSLKKHAPLGREMARPPDSDGDEEGGEAGLASQMGARSNSVDFDTDDAVEYGSTPLLPSMVGI